MNLVQRMVMSISFTSVLFAALTVVTGCGDSGNESTLDGARVDTLAPYLAEVGKQSDTRTSPSDLAPSHDVAIVDASHDKALLPDVQNYDVAIDLVESDVPVQDSAIDLAVEAGGSDLGPSPDSGSAAELCTSTLGTVTTALCCAAVTDFPNQCTTGACGCAPAYSHNVSRCSCSSGCFMPGLGCVGPALVCTVGANLTCNDNPVISSIRGRCVEGGRCVCLMGQGLNPLTGKCQ